MHMCSPPGNHAPRTVSLLYILVHCEPAAPVLQDSLDDRTARSQRHHAVSVHRPVRQTSRHQLTSPSS